MTVVCRLIPPAVVSLEISLFDRLRGWFPSRKARFMITRTRRVSLHAPHAGMTVPDALQAQQGSPFPAAVDWFAGSVGVLWRTSSGSVSWANSAGGTWSTAANWSTGSVPTTTSSVTVSLAGTYTIDITAAAAANSLSVADASATIDDAATLTLVSTLALTAGTFALGTGGEVVGGTITVGSGGDVQGAGGTLSGVTYEGILDLTTTGASLTLAGVNTFTGATGSGTATIDFTNSDGTNYLYETGTSTLNNATITIGNSANGSNVGGAYSIIENEDTTGKGSVLTLGVNLTIIQAGYEAGLTSTSFSGDGIVNKGTIDAGFSGGYFQIDATNFINSGAINVANNDVLDLTGNVSTTLVDSIKTSTGGVVWIGGTVTGGTITAGNIAVGGGGGTLSGVTYDGTLDLTEDGSSLTLAGADTFAGASGTGTATINFTDSDSTNYLYVAGTSTFNDATIDIGNSINGSNIGGAYSIIENEDTSGNGSVLTLGANLKIVQGGYEAGLTSTSFSGDGIVNNGTIDAGFGGGYFQLNATNFINNGVISTNNGDTLDLTGAVSALLINSIQTATGGIAWVGGTVTGGTIAGANINIGGGGGTLSGVTYEGTLNLTTNGSSLTLAGANTFTGGSGTGTATINFTDSDGTNYLYVAGPSTLNNATIDIGNSLNGSNISGNYSIIENEDTTGKGSVLTLGANLTIVQGGYEAGLICTTFAGDGVVNDGTIDAGFSGGYFQIDATNFINNGTINVAETDTLYLTGSVSAALVNSIQTSTGGIAWIDGTVSGGTITSGTNNIGGYGGTLSGVTYEGTLDLATSGSALTLAGANTFTGTSGSGTATINLTDSDGTNYLYVAGTSTFNDVTIDIGNSLNGSNVNGNYSVIENEDTTGNGSVLTLGADLTIIQGGYEASLASSNFSGDGIVNDGAIDAVFADGYFVVSAKAFTNNGDITVANTDTLLLESTAFSNLKTGTLTGGTYNVFGASILELSAAITTDLASITLSGAGSSIQYLSGSTQVQLDSKLAIIGAGGTLALQSGRDFLATANSGTFTDSGLLSLSAETLSATALSITSTGSLFGYGTVTGAVANNGGIEANGGALLLAGALAGTAGLQIDGQSVLEIGAATTAQETVRFDGTGATLKLDAPSKFSSVLAGFGAGNIIDFTGLAVSNVSTSGTSLTAVSATVTATLTLATALAPEHLVLGTDGNGGTDITAYGFAQSSTHSPEPVTFGNVHVGASASQYLALSNIATANGYSEALDAAIAAGTGAISASGSFTRLAAGGTNSSSLLVGLDTAVAGAITGTAIISLDSDGTSIDGYGQTSLGTQTVTITGAVYAYAQGKQANSGTLALGNTHVGQAISAYLSLTNSAAANGYSEALDAHLSGASTGFSASGTLMGLRAGGTNNSTLLVDYTDTNAGAFTGAATLNLTSDGTGIDGLGTTALASQSVKITGAAYAYANGSTANGGVVVLANSHVGQAATGYVSLTNSATANGYSEALDASLATSAAGFTAGGTVIGLAAGATSNSILKVGYTAAAGGAYSGTAALGLTSDGTGIDGLGTTALSSQSVTITGAAYSYAVAQLSTLTINLGVVHVGAIDSGTLGLSNIAVTNGYSEGLDASWGAAASGLTLSGSVTGLAAGASNLTSLLVSLATSTSGSFSVQALLDLLSDGTGIDGLGTTALAAGTITVTGIVDNYAVAGFQDMGGYAITGSGTNFAIDLGSTVQGGAALSLSLGALNEATGLADLLQGTLSTAGGAGFVDAGFGTFSGLAAGLGELAQSVTLTTTGAGIFTETIVLSSAGINASGYDGALAAETLTITGTVYSNGGASNAYTLTAGANDIFGANGGDTIVATSVSINSLDSLTGGSGSNTLVLSGGGLFDLGAPQVFSNIQTIAATEGQAASGSDPATYETLILRAGSNETVTVAAGKAATGDKGAETIAIYVGNGTHQITLATGADAVFLGAGSDTVILGGATNKVTAGTGAAFVEATAAHAGAAVVGNTNGTTTLDLTSAGTATLNAADTYLTVDLVASSKLTLDKLGFITANGGAGSDTIVAGAANQTLIGGGADVLTGFTGGSDSFMGASAALNHDTIGNWTTGDVIDLTDMNSATLQALSYVDGTKAGTLTVQDGTHSSAITFSTGTLSLANFVVMGGDGDGGTLIVYQS